MSDSSDDLFVGHERSNATPGLNHLERLVAGGIAAPRVRGMKPDVAARVVFTYKADPLGSVPNGLVEKVGQTCLGDVALGVARKANVVLDVVDDGTLLRRRRCETCTKPFSTKDPAQFSCRECRRTVDMPAPKLPGLARSGGLARCTRSNGEVYFRAWLWLANGERVRVSLPAADEQDEGLAREAAIQLLHREQQDGLILAARVSRRAPRRSGDKWAESADEWYDRFAEYRTALGLKSARKDRGAWRKWVSPVIGQQPMAQLSSRDAEVVRNRLDTAIAGQRITSRTARNVWAVFTTACRHGAFSRNVTLRVLRNDPSVGVFPPEEISR